MTTDGAGAGLGIGTPHYQRAAGGRVSGVEPRRWACACAVFFVVLGVSMAASATRASAASAARVPLSVHVHDYKKHYTIGNTARCERMLILEVAVPPGIVSYQASAVQTNAGNRVQSFSGPPFTNPIAYGDMSYTEPKGMAGWLLGAGSGGEPCPSSDGLFVNLKAFGVRGGAVLSGKVTDECGADVTGAAVSADASGGGTSNATTTGSNGKYSMALSPGTYRVHASEHGVTANPPSLNVTMSQGSQTANFVTRTACSLKVEVTPKPVRSGLKIHSHPYNQFPVDFVNGKSGGGAQCESGCTDILVTVTDPKTHQAIMGAKVNATVRDSPSLGAGGAQSYLCATDDKGLVNLGCNTTHVFGVLTDFMGQAYLRYWAPGVITPGQTTLSVTAQTPQGRLAAAPLVLHVEPYLIYQNTAGLTAKQTNLLVEWAGGPGPFTTFLQTTTDASNELKASLKWLKALELATETAVKGLEALEKVEPVLYVAEAFRLYSEKTERKAMIDMFLKNTKLNPTGLGYPPFEASSHTAPSLTFTNKLVSLLGALVPIYDVKDGIWWAWANELKKVEDGEKIKIDIGGQIREVKADLTHWGVKLEVFEVSECDPMKGACAPGYGNDPGFAQVLRDGIQPQLHFVITLLYQGHAYRREDFDMPYDAIAWTESQHNLLRVTPEFT